MKIKDLRGDALTTAVHNLFLALLVAVGTGEAEGTIEEFNEMCAEWDFDENGEVI